MKKGQQKKQQKALKKRVEAKLDRKAERQIIAWGKKYMVQQARSYPIESCWIRADWQKAGITPVFVVRRQPDGNLLFGCYMVDLYCLGVKDAFWRSDVPLAAFKRDFMAKSFANTTPLEISVDMAHEIVYGALEYAARLGFKPHADFELAQYVLDPPDAHPRSGEIEFGKDGKPFYVSGPYDDVDAIMSHLFHTQGPDDFHFMTRVDPTTGEFFEEDEDDGEEGEEGEDEDDDLPEAGDVEVVELDDVPEPVKRSLFSALADKFARWRS